MVLCKKRLYFAPMEGITTWVYRNIHSELFGGCDEYFAPFITPTDNEKLSIKSLRDILPEHNRDISLRVQVLTNSSTAFFKFEKRICELGYESININMGCPSGTVVKKGRGAGILKTPQIIDELLKNVTENSSVEVSVKTRIGYHSADETDEIFEIFNRHRFSELIVHPRTRDELYGGFPHRDIYGKIGKSALNPVCYNGNIFSAENFNILSESFPHTDAFMIGRGALANPAIFREIKGGKPLSSEELVEFSDRLTEKYKEVLRSEVYTIHKLKELWLYFLWNYPDEKKLCKEIKKANSISELKSAARRLPQIEKI